MLLFLNKGTESSTSYYETSLPCSDANSTASAFSKITNIELFFILVSASPQFLGEASLEEQSDDRCLVSVTCLSTPPLLPLTVTFPCSSGGSTVRNDLVTSSHGSLIPDDYEVVEKQTLKQEYGKDVFSMIVVVSPFALRYEPNTADINNEALPLYSKELKEEHQCSKFIFEEHVASNVVSWRKGPKRAKRKFCTCFGPRKTCKKVPQNKIKARKRKEAENAYKQQSVFSADSLFLAV